MSDSSPHHPPPTIETHHLNYTFPNTTPGLIDINLSLPAGSRTLLIGANGAGKTTLLRLLSGTRLAPAGSIHVSGVDPFSAHLSGVTYLGLEWVLNPVVRSDIDVVTLLSSVGGDAYPARRDELVDILDIDLRWRLHAVSDGERRRVQLAMGLIRPWSVLLLDEVTVDLDLLTRRRFLGWLKGQTQTEDQEGQGGAGGRATVVYATHVLDGLLGWPTHLVHMRAGEVRECGGVEGLLGHGRGEGGSALADLALGWLEDDLRVRGPRNKNEDGEEGNGKGVGMMDSEGFGGYGYEKRRRDS
ncbi:MAG: CCR4-NOT regulatory complex component [Peltula sp. TS41687]|nr:MAG: CCR4-NOT regulatory complex component [Peltula sp. TS41687]